jgi:signal transduction histidine kinase/DNA-binding NarL/FixJ family response regulator
MVTENEEFEFSRAVLDAAPLGVTIFDDSFNILECNNTILNLLGSDKDFFVQNFFEFSPEIQPDGETSLEKAYKMLSGALEGEDITFEWMHQTSKGVQIPFEITLSRTMHSGRYIIFAYQYDIHYVKNMTNELKNRLEQQELISEISRSLVSSVDSKQLLKSALAKLGNYYKVSHAAIFSLNYQNGETVLEHHWTSNEKPPKRKKLNAQDFIKSRFPERLYSITAMPIVSCVDTSTSDIDAFRLLMEENIIAFICAPLYVEGKLWGMFVVEQDCFRVWTDSEKNFVAIIASTIAGAIMLDIYNSKMKDAVTEVMAASKAKSEFLSNMNHEMRTPMNAIINMTAIGKNSNDIERKNYSLDKIGDASTHLLGVINDILDMSKIEAKKFELVPVEFNFNKMIDRVVTVVNFRIEEKHQKLLVHIDKEIPKTQKGDDQRISQVITNLLGNAVKFTPENGSISLNAQFLGENDTSCKIQISVTDTGIGISKDAQKKLFKSFQQAEASTSRKYGGTGLGLSISKSFVEMMGGTIWVESEYGKGSTFAFTMNVEKVKESKEEKKKDENKEIASDFSGHRILLVEDMEINREIVTMLLESTKLEIDCAENGIQAVEMYIEEPERYEMILMDVHMPGMDGYEATRRIRIFEDRWIKKQLQKDEKSADLTEDEARSQTKKDNVRRHIPIIAMTANVFKEDIDNCLSAGMNDHVGKPVDFEIVLEKLNKYLIA